MTRKQFFKSIGLDQPKDKQPFIDLIKSYGGRLSYEKMYDLICFATWERKMGKKIIDYIKNAMEKVNEMAEIPSFLEWLTGGAKRQISKK